MRTISNVAEPLQEHFDRMFPEAEEVYLKAQKKRDELYEEYMHALQEQSESDDSTYVDFCLARYEMYLETYTKIKDAYECIENACQMMRKYNDEINNEIMTFFRKGDVYVDKIIKHISSMREVPTLTQSSVQEFTMANNINALNQRGKIVQELSSVDLKINSITNDRCLTNKQKIDRLGIIANEVSKASLSNNELSKGSLRDYIIDNNGIIIGDNGELFARVRNEYDQKKFGLNKYDTSVIKTISPSLIEGIHLNENEVNDHNIFWGRGDKNKTEKSFNLIAQKIPIVEKMLEAGIPLSEIIEDDIFGVTASIYFDPNNIPTVIKCGDFYEFVGNGRHRILAARNMGYNIKVKVIGERDISQLKKRLGNSNINRNISAKYKANHNVASKITNVMQDLSEVNTFDGLEKYMDEKYDIQLDSSIRSLNIDVIKEAIRGVEEVVKVYPDVGKFLKVAMTSNSGVMACTGSKLLFNPNFFNNNYMLSKVCKDNSKVGYWIENASPASIGVHEAAHGIEWALIQANKEYVTNYDMTQAWNNCVEAKKIVTAACKKIRNTTYGQGKSSTELVESISKYALKNDSETMAEAFADIYANGNNAKPLSIEILRVTKKMMEQYKKGENFNVN